MQTVVEGNRFSGRGILSSRGSVGEFNNVVNLRELLNAGGIPSKQHLGDDEVAMMENSIVTRQFNKAFSYLEQKAKQASTEDDSIDVNMKAMILNFMQL